MYKTNLVGLGLGDINGLSTHDSAFFTAGSSNIKQEFYQYQIAEVISSDLFPDKPENVGRIKFRAIHNPGQNDSSLSFAFPLNPYYRMYPLVGEIVVIVDFDGRYYWSDILNLLNTVNNNLQTNVSDKNINTENQGDVNDYKEVQTSGIPNSENNSSLDEGNIFRKKRLKVGTLIPNAGDVIIEGRFANSIRLGKSETDSPNIKMSVRDLLESYSTDIENIDNDSCIFITTDEILNFTPISIPISTENNPPEEYNGKQILIVSDRLIFGSKLNEILLFSNKTISLSSNDNFSVDSGKKIVTHTVENTELNTKSQFIVKSDKETKLQALKVHVGSLNCTEPLVLGNKWKQIMIELIDAILQETHPTGTGPSGPPINSNTFIKIKNKISSNEQLSDDNFTTKRNV